MMAFPVVALSPCLLILTPTDTSFPLSQDGAFAGSLDVGAEHVSAMGVDVDNHRITIARARTRGLELFDVSETLPRRLWKGLASDYHEDMITLLVMSEGVVYAVSGDSTATSQWSLQCSKRDGRHMDTEVWSMVLEGYGRIVTQALRGDRADDVQRVMISDDGELIVGTEAGLVYGWLVREATRAPFTLQSFA